MKYIQTGLGEVAVPNFDLGLETKDGCLPIELNPNVRTLIAWTPEQIEAAKIKYAECLENKKTESLPAKVAPIVAKAAIAKTTGLPIILGSILLAAVL